MLLFRDEGHVDRWCEARDLSRGAVITPEQAWVLAQGWYKDKLRPEWQRHTVDETEALLRTIGLTSRFWDLR